MVKGYTATERMVGGLRKAHWAIQRVLVSKDVPIARANDMANHILHKQLKGAPVGKFYHYRNIPKTSFIKGTFRTKQIKAGLKLVFGELKPEHSHMVGGGLFDYFKRGYDYVKEKVSGAVDTVKEKASDVVDTVKEKVSSALTISDYSKNTKANLEKYGSQQITALTIYRKPIEDWINKVFQGVSVGKWESLKKKYGMDKFFHLTLVCEVYGGRKVAVEKLEVISVNENIPSGEGVETQEVPMDGKLFTIREMLDKTRVNMGDAKFFSYDALRGNNCQNFVAELLKAVDLYRAAEKGFVFQDITSLVAELPQHLLTFQKATTNLGALFNKATGIGGRMSGGAYDFKLDDLMRRIKKLEDRMVGGKLSLNERGEVVDEEGRVYRMSVSPEEERLARMSIPERVGHDLSDTFGKMRNFYGFGKFRNEMSPQELYEDYWRRQGQAPPPPRTTARAMFRNEMTPEELHADFKMKGYGFPEDLAPPPHGRPRMEGPRQYGSLVELEKQMGRY